MTLVVPRMGVRCRVMDGTSQAKLKKGPGLYDVSDLPAEADTNVVIAGHRNVYGSWFYNIDKMEPGEKIVLLFGDREYIYECEKIEIIEPNDWSVSARPPDRPRTKMKKTRPPLRGFRPCFFYCAAIKNSDPIRARLALAGNCRACDKK